MRDIHEPLESRLTAAPRRPAAALTLTAVLLLALAGIGCPAMEPPQPVGDPAPPERPPADALGTEPASDAGEDTPEKKLSNTLRWSTASEVDNFGFDVYRAESEDGPFERITTSPIPGFGTTDEPRKYVFEDENIDPTRDYYYYVESIAMNGVREQFTPIVRAKAKRPPDGEEDTGDGDTEEDGGR